jgi:hypothetical protein
MTRETRFEEEDSRILHKLAKQVEQDHKLLELILNILQPKFFPPVGIVVIPAQFDNSGPKLTPVRR